MPPPSLHLQQFSDSLVGQPVADLNSEILKNVALCLRTDGMSHAGAEGAAHAYLVQKLARVRRLGFASIARLDPAVREVLLAYLAFAFTLEEDLERLLVPLRHSLLQSVIAKADLSNDDLDLVCALAIYAFSQEYIFAETPDETAVLRGLSIYGGPAQVAMLACYRPLHRLHEPVWLLETEAPTPLFALMLKRQLVEPLEEQKIRATLRALTPISDAVSINVQKMYEENPYPRWTKLALRPVASPKSRRILIAGCGSGQQPISWAKRNPLAEIVGVDLSRVSLAYAQRKALEYGIQNLSLFHGDILQLPNLDLAFDFITCFGVLHHMAAPLQGLRALCAVLADGGRIQLGLYSQLGRQCVVEAIALRDQLGVAATPEGIRRLRQHIFALPEGEGAREVTKFVDFYNMSGCRDLIFHVQEHRFDLPRVAKLLSDAGLALIEFEASPELRDKFHRQVPGGDLLNLDDWHTFECLNPLAFKSMYGLKVVKA